MRRMRSPILRCVIVGTVAILGYAFLPLQGEHTWLGVAGGVALIAAAIPVMLHVLRRVNDADRPIVDALAFLGALGVLAIVIPASVYVVTVELSPGSFAELETKIDGIYFTVTVLSTVGFGDIVPVSQGARLMTTAHILLSIIVLGSMVRLVSRVVGLRIAERHRDGDE